MHDRELVGMISNNPVQAPFKHCEGLVDRKGFERCHTVKIEIDLRPEPAPDQVRRRNIDSKIDELITECQWKIAIQLLNASLNLGQIRAQRNVKSTNGDFQTRTTKTVGNFSWA